ncbi:MAG: PAS domain S-box protein [Ardenticatenaceae bacterium]
MNKLKHPYWVAIGLLLVLALGQKTATWRSDVHVHTILEVAATVLAAVVGSLALVRFYSKKSNRFLFIGAGFIATALFDGYHGVVTSEWFYRNFPSNLSELAPWSWLVSRLFLSILLWLSVVARERDNESQKKRDEVMVYLVVSLLALVFFVFFTQDPLPQAYQEEWILHRPMELLPALFFLLALIGYYRKGDSRSDGFWQWILMALIVNLAVQIFFMPFSKSLHDEMFDVAHLLKIVSYALVLVGLARSMSELVQQVEQGLLALRQVNSELQHEIGERKKAEKQLRQRSTILAEAQRLAHLGSWDWNVSSGQVNWSDELYRIFGYEEQSFPVTIDTFIEHVHPDNQEMVRNALARMSDNQEPLEHYLRIVRPDSEARILHIRFHVIMSETPKHVWGTAQDVTERFLASKALRKSELRFRSVTESANDAIVSADSEGRIVYWNKSAQRIFGYDKSQAHRMPLTELVVGSYITEHQVLDFPSGQVQVIDESLEMEGRHKKGRQFPIEVSLAWWQIGEDNFCTAIIRDISKRKKVEAELTETQQRLANSREEEQLNLAQELHDGPLQSLIAVRFQLAALKKIISNQNACKQLKSSQNDLHIIMDRLRTMCYELRPPVLSPFGLEPAIRDHAEHFSKTHPDIQMQLELDEDHQTLPEHFRLTLYRICQHALANIARHAEAANIRIQFKLDPNQITLKIMDDGCGFIVPDNFLELARLGHLGLLGSKERANAIGGKLQVQSAPDEGTTLLVTAPRPN